MTELRERAIEFMQKFNGDDLEEIVSSFGERGEFVDPQGESHRGKAAIRRALGEIVAATDLKTRYAVTDAIIDDSQNRAAVAWTLTMTAGDGTASTMRGVDLLRFDSDGVAVKNCFMKASELLVES